MSIATTTHLNFRGEARAALDFYASVFGGTLVAFTYADIGAPVPADEAGNIVWGQVTSPAGFSVMAYDVPSHLPFVRGENSFFVSVRSTDREELAARWAALSAGATIRQPLAPAGWSKLYGMLEDRFGIVFVFDVIPAPPTA